MKNFVVRLSLAAALFAAAIHLHAQAADVTGGSMTLSMTSTLLADLQAQGVSGSSYTPTSFGTRAPFLAATSGVFDLASGSGSFSVNGVLLFTGATDKIKVVDMSFETMGPYPVVVGSIYLNNHFVVRNVILDISCPDPLHVPLQAAPLYVTGIPATLSPNVIALLAHTFNVTVPPAAIAATITVNIGLTPDTVQ